VQLLRLTLFSNAHSGFEKDWEGSYWQPRLRTATSVPGGDASLAGLCRRPAFFAHVGSRAEHCPLCRRDLMKAPLTSRFLRLAMGVRFGRIFKTMPLAQRDSIPVIRLASVQFSPATKDRSEAYQHLDDLLKSVTLDAGPHGDLLYPRQLARDSTHPPGSDQSPHNVECALHLRKFVQITAEQVSGSCF